VLFEGGGVVNGELLNYRIRFVSSWKMESTYLRTPVFEKIQYRYITIFSVNILPVVIKTEDCTYLGYSLSSVALSTSKSYLVFGTI